MGKVLIIVGSIILIAGIMIELSPRIPWLGKLPGDLSWEGKNYRVIAPITTSILLSILISLILWLINKFRG